MCTLGCLLKFEVPLDVFVKPFYHTSRFKDNGNTVRYPWIFDPFEPFFNLRGLNEKSPVSFFLITLNLKLVMEDKRKFVIKS